MIDFVIEKKSLDSAIKQVLFGRSGAYEDLVDLKVEHSMLTLVAMGTNADVPVTSDASESVSITVGDLAKLKKVSATYKAGPVRIRIGDGRIRFQNTSIGVSVSEAASARRVIDIPIDASVFDLVSLPAIFSSQEIEHCGLQARVQKEKGFCSRHAAERSFKHGGNSASLAQKYLQWRKPSSNLMLLR